VIGDGGFYSNNGDGTYSDLLVSTGMLFNSFSDVNGDDNIDVIFPGAWLENSSGEYSFEIVLTDESAGTTSWILTNDQDVIVAIDDQDPPLMYGLMPLGTFSLRHIVYNGSLTGLTVGENIAGLIGDYDLSNVITLNSLPSLSRDG